MTITDDELAEIGRLEKAATPLPWRWENSPGAGLQIFGTTDTIHQFLEATFRPGEHNILGLREMPTEVEERHRLGGEALLAYERWVRFEPKEWNAMQEANMAFIVSARKAVPKLLAEVRRLREELERKGPFLVEILPGWSVGDIDYDSLAEDMQKVGANRVITAGLKITRVEGSVDAVELAAKLTRKVEALRAEWVREHASGSPHDDVPFEECSLASCQRVCKALEEKT